ncbi:hypothetical protein [Xenorhabdus bovienii]|uniref:hypothetical protein n=1 Tax=Xenorhabdus bovienii TaxID=40576 RepID=UPI0023B33838|nr:hypothetical protein [Xenorhabdus bovienii]MDE9464564.1 hypothetical protein [Xenorhabdus bovienii]
MGVYLQTFEAYFVAGSSKVTDRLYANGNQQVKVAINIRKQVDGLDMPLTPEEKESVTIVALSTNVNAPIYAGWSCDKTKNEYDEGLRGEKGGQYAEDNLTYLNNQQKQGEERKSAGPETIYRYLRAAANASEAMEFMAVVTIDGEKFTTNMDPHRQILIVTPYLPYEIKTNELSLKRDDAFNFQYAPWKMVDVDIYYWTLPSSLIIMYQTLVGGKPVLSVGTTAGQTSGSGDRARVCLVLDTRTEKLIVIDILGVSKAPCGTSIVPLVSGNSIIRGLRLSCDSHVESDREEYNKGCVVTIVDNLGCVSKLTVRPFEDFNRIDIYDE